MKEFPREIQADIALHLHKDLFNLPAFQIENEVLIINFSCVWLWTHAWACLVECAFVQNRNFG